MKEPTLEEYCAEALNELKRELADAAARGHYVTSRCTLSEEKRVFTVTIHVKK